MRKYQCEKCGALYAGWGESKICEKCGGKLKVITYEKYYEEQKIRDKASKHKRETSRI